MIWFTADHHFAHSNIIKYRSRPFADVDEMDKELIFRWNEVVDKDDTVYHLGDFTLQGPITARWFFSRLNGNIHILGNPWHHDRRWLRSDLLYYSGSGHEVKVLPPMFVLGIDRGMRYPFPIILCHYPIAEWDRRHHDSYHLHAHSHGNFDYKYHRLDHALMLDVGVDVHDFRPISLTQVTEYMKGKSYES